MKRKKGKKGVVMGLYRPSPDFTDVYWLGETMIIAPTKPLRAIPQLKPGDSCNVRVTIERVK